MAKIIEERYRDIQGRDRGLLVASRAFLVLGVAACLIGIGLAAVTGVFAWIAAGIGCAVAGVVLFLVLGALSEVIVLLKKILGLPAGGVISGTGMGSVWVCSECGASVWPDSYVCASCGADFLPGPAERPEEQP